MNIRSCTQLMILLAFLSAAITSHAATITVANKNNSGAGSLRQAIIDANNGDTIKFATSLKGSIQLVSPLLIDKDLFINGPGANILGIDGRAEPTESRVFTIFTANARISDLRLARGFSSGAGGAITVESGGSLTLNNCLVVGNSAESAGGIFGSSGSIITITNSTIYGNAAAVEGGGISNRGGTLVLTNSLVVANEAPDGGGVSVDNGGTATILNSTITQNGNNGSPSGDIGGLRIVIGSTVNLKNTIVAGNIVSGTSVPDVGGAVISQGTNLIGNATGGSGFVASDLLNIDPLLGGFANNGGGTYTFSLLPTSPAINAGTNTGAPATDQRGVARPQGPAVDIGSYESGVIPQAFGKIVFVDIAGTDREVFSMNADGSNQLNLTNNSARDDLPRWSPDGSKIVFVSDRDGNDEIYSMNADGTAPTRLTNNIVADENPAFSPDGSKIAFDRGGQIFVMNTNGTGVIQASGSGFSGIKGRPSWSPDGSQIIFHNNRGFGDYRIQTIGSTCGGCNGTTLVNDIAPDNFDPVWSPDSNSIAFSNDQVDLNDHSQPNTYLFSPFLNNLFFPTRALPTTLRMFSPAWSPDGTKFVYQTSGSCLATIGADGGNVLSLGRCGLHPDWAGSNTSSGTNITALTGTVAVTFANISSGGTTSAAPIDPASAGSVPSGYSLGAGYPAYEITTTATYTSPITVCLQVPSVTNFTTFAALTLMHNEGGVLVDRTVSRNFATKTVCASVSSLSPFVIAEDLDPTTAPVSVSGRALTADGRGIARVRVTMTDSDGVSRSAITSSLGYFRFEDVVTGQTYIISVHSKVHQFAQPTQVVVVADEITGLDFTALP